jgi:hypothetical protein
MPLFWGWLFVERTYPNKKYKMIKINLLPPQQIKRVKMMIAYQNVISSGLIVFLMFLLVIIIMASFLIFLNFKYSLFERNINEEEAKIVQTESIKTMQKGIKEINDDLSEIKKIQDAKSDLYGILDRINEELFRGVEIYALEIDNKSKTINVTGHSSYRENLVEIRDILKDDSRYKNVDFPLSNLANPRDINFRFSFTYIP